MLNPITYAEKIVSDFLRYQLTTYPLADARLYAQMRALLNLETTRATPLLRGPFVSLSRTFLAGKSVAALCEEGLLHPHMKVLAPHAYVYQHQEDAFRAMAQGKTTVVSTGTGSGKTESFLYPIISHCLRLRDEGAPPGIAAVIVYPMNALAEDQYGRLRELLVGTGVSFGLYVGKTPDRAADVVGERLADNASKGDYLAAAARSRARKQHDPVIVPEERPSRDEMRAPGMMPRILLTNVKQLELLLTRQKDIDLFAGARLDYLVFDEAHTFSGAAGAETACLIRRLRSFCGKKPSETVCVATSATIADPERGPEAGRNFASRFFGVEPDRVALVGEKYEEDTWATTRKPSGPLPGEPAVQLQTLLDAVADVEEEPTPEAALKQLKSCFQTMTGTKLDTKHWQESLYTRLSENEVVYQIASALKQPRALETLERELEQRLGRRVPAEEVVAWLALGAVSRREGRPLLRPVIHAFVRGVGGAVVTFPEGGEPRLHLSREAAAEAETLEAGKGTLKTLVRLDVMTCTTCGQHYFTTHAADFAFEGKTPDGGEAVENRRVWKPLDSAAGGRRVVLIDRLASGDPDDDDEPRNTAQVFLCRACGALHETPTQRCDGCGVPGPLVPLLAVGASVDNPGKLSTCVACGAHGFARLGDYREPARPVRAQVVSDVHVLAQSMVHHAERKRLLVFADNRQEAAFQAGWMQDHARRYRLRALMYERLTAGPVSIGDLTGHVDDLLDRDDDLSRSLIPEVWDRDRKETAGTRHVTERRRFLRAQVLREVVTSMKQRIGLEPWGRMLVEYQGLGADLPFFSRWAPRLQCSPEALVDGVATLLDQMRRSSSALYDREGNMYSRFWHESDPEIMRGYFPLMKGGPKGVKLRRGAADSISRIVQLVGSKGVTRLQQAVAGWGMPAGDAPAFYEELWTLLTDELHLLVHVNLIGKRNKVLPGSRGAMQIDGDRLLLHEHKGYFRCATCRRANLRPTPRMACPVYRCDGTLLPVTEKDDDYDLLVLDQRFEMVRPREHSAQVPGDVRDMLERAFKGGSALLNTLVCTPTLELGVDIGALDAVLMRNVPPLPANYWQRAGRAGRRHRMAVNLTYARPQSHDRAYFAEPLKLLGGLIQPPRFNLKNEPMVRKHVHATLLTLLFSLAVGRTGAPGHERDEALRTLETCLPRQIKDYLFDAAENVRSVPFDLGPLATLLSKHRVTLVRGIQQVFTQGWPQEDELVVTGAAIERYVDEASDRLREVIKRLEKRLTWALDQIKRLDETRRKKGTLDPEEDALHARCDRLIKRLKGKEARRRRDAEGYDDTDTYAVLAAEGFLPGYGLDTGTVVGTHMVTRYTPGGKDWELRRALPLALREYVPGNLIYADGRRFIPRHFHLEAQQPTLFNVDTAAGSVAEMGVATAGATGLSNKTLAAVPVCDVELPLHSAITDDEDHRFQLPVSVYGYEQARHGGGVGFTWSDRTLTLRRSLHVRLVNVGTARATREGESLGYPLCLVCGQSRSPFASKADLDAFRKDHLERCRMHVDNVGFYADAVVDTLAIQSCADLTEAYSVAEALRKAASDVLEMEQRDLQILAIMRSGDPCPDVFLYDPMPGGSGLLDQLTERWGEVVVRAQALMEDCPSKCDKACIDCLLSYRNSYYHKHLDRHVAGELLRIRGGLLQTDHPIPALLPSRPNDEGPANRPEAALLMMLERAGFPTPHAQHAIDLGRPLGVTTPDFFYDAPSDDREGICIYLDGMSSALHGNPATGKRDAVYREELRARGYDVIEISFGQLSDRTAVAVKLRQIGRILLGRDKAATIEADTAWFDAATRAHASEHPPAPGSDWSWDLAIELLEEPWAALARALSDAGLALPDEVEWDLARAADGRTSGERAVLAWTRASPPVALVAEHVEAEAPGYRVVHAGPDANVEQLADALRTALGGAA